MHYITISSSLRFKDQIRQAIESLKSIGIEGLFPNLDATVKKEDVDLEYMKKIEREHLEAINKSKALYVICPEGYVGILTAVEIGYAYAKGKPVIFSEKPADLGLEAIASTYISIEELHKLAKL